MAKVKVCSPSRVKAYTARYKPRCNNGAGCKACKAKYRARWKKGNKLLPGRSRTDNQIEASIEFVAADNRLRAAWEDAEYLSESVRERIKEMTPAQWRAWHEGIFPPNKTPTIIHVNQHVIRSNLKSGDNEPALTVRRGRNGKNAKRAYEVILHGPSVVVSSPDKPLPCGARVWVETHGAVELK